MQYGIDGSDCEALTPINGQIHVAGIIRSPRTPICIQWKKNAFSGVTNCQAWQGQYEIDELTKSGHDIVSVSITN